MDKNFTILLEEFKRISNKGYIRSVTKSFGSIGLTFEKELNKSPDSKYLPDYKGIELKCTSRFSHYPLYLFTIAFDGPNFNEIARITEIYGKPDKDFPDKKVLFAKLNCTYFTEINNQYNFILELSKEEEKIYLAIYDKNHKLIEKISYVNFATIYEHLLTKLSKLALIYASKKTYIKSEYYRYYRIILYTLKSKEKFISLLEKGIIKVGLISRISKSGVDTGRYRNKNLIFEINKDLLYELFDKVYEYNTDFFNKK